MSLQVGRITGLPEPKSWTSSGETAVINGYYSNTADIGAVANFRDRLLGYAYNVDEPAVPVVVDSEPRLSGYYRIEQVSVPSTPATVAKGFFEFQLGVVRVGGYHNPIFEDILTAANRVGPGNSGYGFIGIPSTAKEVIKLTYNSAVIFNRNVFPSPDVVTMHLAFFSTPPWTSSIRYAIPVADYYKGRCYVQTYDGTALREVVGRQLYAPDLTNWVISNGLVKVEPNGAGGFFQVTNVNSSGAWGVTNAFQLWNNTNSLALDTRTSLTLLRNSPEECILRLSMYQSGQVIDGAFYLDIRLRRGQRSAEFTLSSGLINPGPRAWGVYRSAPLAMSFTGNGAMRQTANDASGNRLVMGMAETNVLDLVNCTMSTSVAQPVTHFMIGAEVPGGTAATYETNAEIFSQYCAVVGERVVVVGR